MVSSFNTRLSFYDVSALQADSVGEVYSGSYDFLFAASSWDKRSKSITNSDGIKSKFGFLFTFKSKDSNGWSVQHEKCLVDYFAQNCDEFNCKEVDSTKADENWQLLLNSFRRAVSLVQKPLDVFIDLSTCPRYLSLGLLGYGFSHGLIRKICFGYSEGRYPSESNTSNSKNIFTDGGWKVLGIKGFLGEWEPHRIRHYIVSVGFEGVKTRQLVSKSEPDKVSLLFPRPAISPEYESIAKNNNRKLVEQFQIPESRVVEADAVNIVSGLNSLEDSQLEDFDNENCHYVCCGTKPHSLVLALRSLVLKEPTLLYIVPESHKVSLVEPSGNYWRYTVIDKTALRVS